MDKIFGFTPSPYPRLHPMASFFRRVIAAGLKLADEDGHGQSHQQRDRQLDQAVNSMKLVLKPASSLDLASALLVALECN
jgi:hypothetical protein